jgi:outer membrane receptor protein involved in Fe transport
MLKFVARTPRMFIGLMPQTPSVFCRFIPICALFAPQVFAQYLAAEPAQQLPPIEVVSPSSQSALPVQRDRLPFNAQISSDQDLQKTKPESIADFMNRNFVGVSVNGIQGSPFQADVTYRGFRLSPVLGTSQGISAFLDGVRVNEAFGDVVYWEMIPEMAIARIALMPGSNPLFGLNTLGGALALTTKNGRQNPGVSFDANGGSFKRARLDFGVGHDFGAIHAFVAGTAFRDGGWREDSQGKLGNLFVKIGGASNKTEWDVSALLGRSRLIGNGLLPSTRYEDGEFLPGIYETQRNAIYTSPDITKNTTQHFALNVNHTLSPNTKLSFLAHHRNVRVNTSGADVNPEYEEYVEDCEDGFSAEGTARNVKSCSVTRAEGARVHAAVINETQIRQRTSGVSAVFSHHAGGHQLTAGVSMDQSRVQYQQFQTEGDFDLRRFGVADRDEERAFDAGVRGRSRTLSAYASDTYALAAGTHVTGALRWNRTRVSSTLSNEAGDLPSESFTYSKLNPALGLTHRFGAPLTLYAGLSQGTRVPTVIELGCADPNNACRLPTGLQADPYLKQVVARTGEIGARIRLSSQTRINATAYRTENRDDILFLRAGATNLGYFDNFDRTRREGMEFGVDHNMEDWSFKFDIAHVKATYQAVGVLQLGERNVKVVPGMRIAGIPATTAKFSVDWFVNPQWSVGAQVIAAGNQTTQGNEDGFIDDGEDDEPATKQNWGVKRYALLNFRLDYRPTDKLTAYLRINNTLNRRYETYGAIGADLFPNGKQLAPHIDATDAALAKFIAPGAPRAIFAGVRFAF